MTLEELLMGGAVGAGLLTLVQLSPVKINPWSWVGKLLRRLWTGFCRSLNAEVLTELATLRTGQQETRQTLEEHIALSDKREADSYRASILHFNVELIERRPHTREDFIEILSDIDHYERYCESHPNYENNRAVCAIANIKRVYALRMEKGDFAQ